MAKQGWKNPLIQQSAEAIVQIGGSDNESGKRIADIFDAIKVKVVGAHSND
ncbi:hypothetical protein CU098_013842 [Rhizopus stolonifer]|uniref:Uncharacterized protein n=1 Tax=Rhizopus stolonifer TaxID=4846 RepID=A0A367KX92_RHIST|nr:hypothetical protein CU098_013842 [Rhizopus stolonifer]